jgi:heme exporter protein C
MHFLANPTRFSQLAGKVLPWLSSACFMLFAAGLYYALLASPADYQQGETVRIMYIHVPSAWMAMMIYFVMGVASACFLIWRHVLADVIARESALIGALFTLLCMITGSLWGKPMWGAWWVWDARLTSVLVLFFLYVGYMALDASVEAGERGRKACAWLSLIGLANLPVIHFSVEWWNTLHQPASMIRMEGPAIHPEMLVPLLLMSAAFMFFYKVLLLVRVRAALRIMKVRRSLLQAF